MSKPLKDLKIKLWNANPHCENCGVLTVMAKDCPGIRINEDGIHVFDGPPPDNMATIQHKYSRKHPMRHARMIADRGQERRRFLWCYKCNKDYNLKYENKL